jgi:hypothetical protein
MVPSHSEKRVQATPLPCLTPPLTLGRYRGLAAEATWGRGRRVLEPGEGDCFPLPTTPTLFPSLREAVLRSLNDLFYEGATVVAPNSYDVWAGCRTANRGPDGLIHEPVEAGCFSSGGTGVPPVFGQAVRPAVPAACRRRQSRRSEWPPIENVLTELRNWFLPTRSLRSESVFEPQAGRLCHQCKTHGQDCCATTR